MDDLTSTLQNILDSEEGKKQLRELAQTLGIGPSLPSEEEKEGQGFDLNGLLEKIGLGQQGAPASDKGAKTPDFSELLKSLTGGQNEKEEESSPPFTAADIVKLQQLIQSAGQDNPNTALLKSLRPLLGEERRHKVDEAVKLMKLLSLLAVLRKNGMLGSLLSG